MGGGRVDQPLGVGDSVAIGFSTSRSRRLFRMCSPSWACVSLGVARMTASAVAIASSRSAVANASVPWASGLGPHGSASHDRAQLHAGQRAGDPAVVRAHDAGADDRQVKH